MSLLIATLIPGLILLLVGFPLFLGSTTVASSYRAFPRSLPATYLFFGGGTLWFLYEVWNLSAADFGDYHVALTVGFAAIALCSFKCVPDFLAVRGLAIIVLLGSYPLLMAGYLRFDHPQIYFQKVLLFIPITLAIWLGAQPWRLRDFFEWLFARRERSRLVGGLVAGYGLLLTVMAFTY
jgi:hypothetical protein